MRSEAKWSEEKKSRFSTLIDRNIAQEEKSEFHEEILDFAMFNQFLSKN